MYKCSLSTEIGLLNFVQFSADRLTRKLASNEMDRSPDNVYILVRPVSLVSADDILWCHRLLRLVVMMVENGSIHSHGDRLLREDSLECS